MKIIDSIFFDVIVTLVLLTPSMSGVAQDVRVRREIPYCQAMYPGEDKMKNLCFDFYEPAGESDTLRPLVITLFGGGFVVGSRDYEDMVEWCNRFAENGCAAASIDYRLMPVRKFNTKGLIRTGFMAAQDVSTAVRFFKAHCDKYRIDTNRIFVLGNSAGTIASMNFLWMNDQERPTETFEDDGWLGIGGHSDLGGVHTTGFPEYLSYSPRIAGLIAQWGGVLDTNIIAENDNTPVCLIHGTADETVPYEYGAPYGGSFLGVTSLVLPDLYGSYYIDQRLTSRGVEHELHTFEGKEHCFYIEGTTTLLPEELDTCFRIALAFMTDIIFYQPTPEAISDIDNEPIQVFPNPVEDCLHLQMDDNTSVLSCELYDLQGRLLKVTEKETSMRVKNLPSGTYILHIHTDKGSFNTKVIKK